MSVSDLHSRIYSGHLRHRRYGPVEHGFSYRVYMLYLDLAELQKVFSDHRGWSKWRFGLLSWQRRDYLEPDEPCLDTACRDLVERETGARPTGPIRMLTTVRSFGFGFNPLTVYYCFDELGETVETMIASVTNTPWRQMHNYVLHENMARNTRRNFAAGFAKKLHVSPFNPMDMDYVWRASNPGARAVVHLETHRSGERVFDATLALGGVPATAGELSRVLWRHPLMAWKAVAAIHFEALKLFLRRAPVYDNPHNKKNAGRVRQGEGI